MRGGTLMGIKAACIVIPARYKSSRFPGKPLVNLLNKPMILWVAELSAKAIGAKNVFVATENEEIQKVVQKAGFQAIITSENALTGTDRIAEASEQLNYEIILNVQGDEPLLNPSDILKCLELKQKNFDCIINGFHKISEKENPADITIPKVIFNERQEMIYMSRSPLPAFKEQKNAPQNYYKQVCVYGFSKKDLELYRNFGKKSILEQSEDIEILRFLELDKKILMFETISDTIAVDIPEDVLQAETELKKAKQ